MQDTLTLTPGQALDLHIHRISRTLKPERGTMAEAIYRTGKSYEQLMLANKRRHWIAVHRILKVRANISGWISINSLAIQCKAAWRTVKEALKHTLAEAALQLLLAFRNYRSIRASREGGENLLKTLPSEKEGLEPKAATESVCTVEPERSDGGTAKEKSSVSCILKQQGSAFMGKLARLQQRCLEIAAEAKEREKGIEEMPLPPPRIVRKDRSLALKPDEKLAYLTRARDPAGWNEILDRFKGVFDGIRARNQRPNAAAYVKERF